MEAKQVRDLMEAYASVYANISESHFKVGDEVVCKASGMEGEIVKVDPEGKGKYYTVKGEDGKTKKYSPDELKLDNEEEGDEEKEEGASKEKEGEFHDKLDKMVHKTFGKRPEEKKMKEEVEQVDEAMSSYDRNRKRAAQRAEARNEARRRGQTGNVPGVGYVSPRPERSTYRDESGVERHHTGARMPKKEDQKESFDLFDYLLEYLVAEGYADTNKAALAIMANMSEEWRQSIVEAYQEPRFGKKDYIKKLSKRGGMGMGTPEDPHGYRDPKMAKVGAEFSKRKTAAAKAKKTGEPDSYRAEKEAQSKNR